MNTSLDICFSLRSRLGHFIPYSFLMGIGTELLCCYELYTSFSV